SVLGPSEANTDHTSNTMTVTDTPTWNVIRPRDNRRTAAACTGKANTPAATTVNENAIQCQPGTRHSGCSSGTNASADTTTATQAAAIAHTAENRAMEP